MPIRSQLIEVLDEACRLLNRPENDFSWSGWEDSADALAEVEPLLAQLSSGVMPAGSALSILFAPTGPLQEVSLSSGWGDKFVELANRFDAAMGRDLSCSCSDMEPFRDLGMDAKYAEVSLLRCPACGQIWLRYFYENEAFSRSGRWYLGAVSRDVTAEDAKAVLEGLPEYRYGGSYYDGLTGVSSGPIMI